VNAVCGRVTRGGRQARAVFWIDDAAGLGPGTSRPCTSAPAAVRNYLAGRRDDLLADLAPGAVVSLPERPLRLRSTDAITWARRPRLVAVEVEAPTGQRLTLRYELAVARRDRWYVRAIEVDPTSKGGP
jgi:hypothetical protein